MKPLLLLSTLHQNHAARSGYQALADYLPEARFLHTIRADPKRKLTLPLAQIANRLAFSRWYVAGCDLLEVKAFGELRRGFSGIVHSMWSDHDLGFIDLLLNRRRHRLVGSFHNCDDTFGYTIRFPRRLRSFDAIILMSRTQEPFFLEAGVDPARIHVVLHGVDSEYYRPMGPMGHMGPMFTVLAAGGFRRNFPLLREVCLRLKDETAIRFEVVAPPAWRHLFEDLPNVRFRSGLTNAEFLEAYQTCSCLIQLLENSTANNVILEAMACGKPVVAEKIGGVPEYVDPDSAILTAPGDAEAIVAALLELRASPARYDAMAAGARKRAQLLDWTNIANQMRAIYETL